MAHSDKPDLAFGAPFEGPTPIEPAMTDEDRAILVFERQWWKSAGAKEARIWKDFRMSPARYYQVLGALIDLPEALEFDPMLVRRLRRIRGASAATRFSRRIDADHSAGPLSS